MNAEPRPSLDRELKRGVTEMVLLRLLAEGPSYGYQLVGEVAERSRGGLELASGTLYPLLYRLEEQGLVDTEWADPERGARRKYYRLSRAGTLRLKELAAAWRRFSAQIDALLADAEEGGER
jgi:PadR family transcriptional regulator PadR